MTVNPVISLFYLYFFANFIALVQGINGGGLVLEGQFFELEASSLVFSFLLQVLILLSFLWVFKFFNSRFGFKKITYGRDWGWFLLILQISFLLFNLKAGVNIAGNYSSVEGGSFLNYIFILLQPDIFFVLIGVSLISGRLFFINMIVFLLSMSLRGWMGGFFIVFFVILVRYYPVNVSFRNLCLLLFVSVLFIIVLPVVIDMKWSMRQGVPLGDFFSNISGSLSAENYSSAVSYLLNRFQHLGHVALLLENSDKLYLDLSNGIFSSYWLDGLPQYAVSKLLDLDQYKLNSYMVEYFFGVESPTWNTNPGVAGWIFILQEQAVFLVLYLFFVVVAPFYFIGRYVDSTLLMLLACYSITYLFHGWFGAYFNILFYALVLVVVRRLKFINGPGVGLLTSKAAN